MMVLDGFCIENFGTANGFAGFGWLNVLGIS